MAVTPPIGQPYWPQLRDDLQLLPGQPENGHPTWRLYDPAAHRYIKLPWYDVEALNQWHLGDAGKIAAALRVETTINANPADIEQLRDFLVGAKLTLPNTPDKTKQFVGILARRRSNPVKWLIHHYLFVSLTLCNPDGVLGRWERRFRYITGRRLWLLIAALGISALCAISQQWDIFVHDIGDLWSWRGFALVGSAYFASKIIHEIGHGLAAKRLGCGVPSMGLALLVLCPVLWTNTTNAWRLTSPRARIAIDIAGMTAELLLGSVAAWFWVILPDGIAREAALALAASSWVLALTINLNPLMRFDGYYILSDLMGVENLQERGFSYMRWILRRIIFGAVPLDTEPGELPKRRKALVACWALGTWVYRLFLFFGIALLVYHATFKALGLLLMGIEIGVFILMPIIREARVWGRSFVHAPAQGRTRFIVACVAASIALFFPWSSHLRLPAVIEASEQTELTSREHGTIRYVVHDGASVAKGDPILVLSDATIEREVTRANAEWRYWRDTTNQLMRNVDAHKSLSDSIAHKAAAAAALQKANEHRSSLTLRAPFSGIIRDVPESMRKGNLIARHQKIAFLIAQGQARVTAYAAQEDLDYLHVGDHARFIPSDGSERVTAILRTVADYPEDTIEKSVLWNAGKGALKAKMLSGKLKADKALYRIDAFSESGEVAGMQVPGTVVIKGSPKVMAFYFGRKFFSLMLNETAE
ncbi:HlyD family efflux transporter periplasmic adaptor subunit [Asaia sp. As-1742]|uniref:HlyD family efflux transporter periplasmic adaptor subunit n=1 Tax=Asaia sp. As-1742 TaxID=2608325 RepID=UPI0014236642|nr:HlyD family efflux transporter periplasmic adaptor subunit [Asaia sp. As-1742]